MKIFPKDAPKTKGPARTEGKSEGIKRKKAEAPPRKDVSPSEIREKLAARVETSEAAKTMASKNTQKLGEGFLNDEFKAPPVIVKEEVKTEEKSPNTENFVLNSDIAKNNPKDTNTQEKLKTALSKGAFNFNPKEREALEKILADR